jgi:predicted DNA-binding protein
MSTMRRTAIFLPEDQSERLQLLTELTGAPMSELIRRGIEAYLETRADEIAEARKAKKARGK